MDGRQSDQHDEQANMLDYLKNVNKQFDELKL